MKIIPVCRTAFIATLTLLSNLNLSAQSESSLNALLNFNFAGSENKWTNLTPVIFYGWTADAVVKDHPKLMNTFQVGPYIGTTLSIDNESTYMPALMLPGNAGLQANYYLTIGCEDKAKFIFSPINFGLKVISGFKDSDLGIIQHNIRHAVGFEFADFFSMSVQYSQGWHNSTDQSQKNFLEIFQNGYSKIEYWNITMNTRLSKDLVKDGNLETPLVLTISWRAISDRTHYDSFSNYRIFTVGLNTTINLKSGNNPGFGAKLL